AGEDAAAAAERAKSDELKEIRQRFAKLHEKAFAEPYNAAVRRELAATALQMGRQDLAQVWQAAAAAIEDVTGEKPAAGKKPADEPPAAEKPDNETATSKSP